MFRKNLLAHTLALAFGGMAAGLTLAPAAYAQSNATGTVFGRLGAGAGTAVTLESSATGFKRTIALAADGRFSFTALAPGNYKATLLDGDKVKDSVELVVRLSQGTEAIFASSTQTVEVSARRITIDVTSTNVGTNFNAEQLAAIPVGQNITSIIALAPDTVKADPRYPGGASIGGGAPSENAYYINGMPVTNPLTQLGSIELPFTAIGNVDVKTGGFGAEFGRSTGGVVSITSKTGTNEWKGQAAISIDPNSLSAKARDMYYPNTGVNPGSDGTLYALRHKNTSTQTVAGVALGGPLVKDKLLMFIAADTTRTQSAGYAANAFGPNYSSSASYAGYSKSTDIENRYLLKLDWALTNDHRIEFTSLGDNFTTKYSAFGVDTTTAAVSDTPSFVGNFKNLAGYTPQVGGSANIVKYTGNLTQDLTFTALYGETLSKHREFYTPDLGGGLPGVNWTSTGRAPGLTYNNLQPLVGSNVSNALSSDSTTSTRFDLEYQLGDHLLRAGLDENKLHSSGAGDHTAGGSTWTYRKTSKPDNTITQGSAKFKINDGSGPLSAAGYYVTQRIFNDVTDAASDQSAYYFEDQFHVTKNLMVVGGLRNESFKGINGDGETFLKSENFWSPRLSASWDVNGDATLKIYGNLGRYSIQTPTHLAVRGASRSLFTTQYFTYTGVDATTGLPTGLKALDQPYSSNNEYYQAKDAKTISSLGIKPSYQDEFIAGFEKALTPKWNAGVKLTYRKLGATMDDFCDTPDGSCIIINPGKDVNYYSANGDGTYTLNQVSAADTGLPKPKRTFLALDFSLTHPLSDGWYGSLGYTWSKNKGNTEGQTKSDNGQTDVAATSTWDAASLMENSYGYLPNDRTHQIKANGYVVLTPEWTVGSAGSISSGRPKNCFGNYAGTGVDAQYGSVNFFCSYNSGKVSVPTPRGSQGRLPWDYNIDVNFAYKPAVVKGLTLRADIFNLFNKQGIVAIDETHEATQDKSTILSTYGRVISYDTPRHIKLSASYDF